MLARERSDADELMRLPQVDPRRWRFQTHGETGMVYRMTARVGDDCDLVDDRGRTLRAVPFELLEEVV